MQIKEEKDKLMLKALLEYANSIIATLRDPFLVLDGKLRVISANQSFYITFEVAENDTIGRDIFDLGNRQWSIPKLISLLKEIIPEKKLVKDYEVEHSFEQIGQRIMILNACQLRVPKKIAATISTMAVGSSEEEKEDEEELILLTIEDITDRKRLQEELKDSEERYRQAFETSRDGLLLIDKIDGDVLNSNDSAQKLLGYSKEEFLKEKLWDIGVTKNSEDFRAMMLRVTADGVVNYEDTVVETKRGSKINADVFLVDRSKVLQCNIRNIDERKHREEELRVSLKEKHLLLQELNHRVNNNLQLMMNLVSLQRKQITDEKIIAIFDDTQSRIKSIALVHEKLYLSKGFSNINFKEYLNDLAQSIFKSFISSEHELSLKIDIEDFMMEIENAVTCGLIVNEILSNVFKYAFPGNRNGKVELSFHRVEKGNKELIIKDNGIGIPADVDLRATKSLGMQLIYNLVEKQLAGTIVIDRSSGTMFKIIFKEEPIRVH